MIFQWLFVAALTFILDIVWAKYTKYVAENRPVVAGLYAVGMYLLGGVTVLQYTQKPILIIPAAAGAFFGTYIGVKH